jgi:hypothetical protein
MQSNKERLSNMDKQRYAIRHQWLLLIGMVLVMNMLAVGCTNQDQSTLQDQVNALNTTVWDLQATLEFVSTVQSYQSTRIGLAQAEQDDIGPVVTTAAPQPPGITFTPSPTMSSTVAGSVEIEGGICCAGGRPGDTIQLSVAFEAVSTQGEVVEMRYATAYIQADEERMSEEPWVPFQSEISFSTQLAVNWVGWWISVQYRDAQGNVSPIYYDDISLEGN